MPLLTDTLTPAEATGYVRQRLDDMERAKGSLAEWLPNRYIGDMLVSFLAGRSGLIESARWRALDAEPEVGRVNPGKKVTVEMNSVAQEIPISERDQQRVRYSSDDVLRGLVYDRLDQVALAVNSAVTHLRGVVLATGKATISQSNFASSDDFGRRTDFTTTAPTLWTLPATSRLAYLETLTDLYVAENGSPPGALLAGRQVIRALQAGDEFKTALVGGGSRPASLVEVQTILDGYGLPTIYPYDRKVMVGSASVPVIPSDTLLLLPAPVAPDDWAGSEMGVTFWGQTVTADLPEFGLADDQMPGVVAGVWQNDKVPAKMLVQSDGLVLPVLANANLSLAAKVL